MTQDAASRQELYTALERFRQWYCEAALPFWAAHGVEASSGGFYEALNFDGTPSINRPRRVRTQARQIHTFTQAGLHGWLDGAEEIAARGFDYFLQHACPDGGARGCVFHIDDDGRVLDDRRDLYDQAFVLLACASRYAAGDKTGALALADKTIDFLDRELASQHGGWLESDRTELPRRQNPHMHLFEAFMALYRNTKQVKYLRYADKVHDLFCTAFFDSDGGVIREHFTENWSPIEASMIEPGHMLEWCWLLSAYQACGRKPATGAQTTLYERAISLGAAPAFHGFVDNAVSPEDHKAPGAKRLWPQTEYLRASIAQLATGEADAGPRVTQLIENLFKTYLDVKPAGLWIDEFDGAGTPCARDVPASILYHLFEAVAEADAYLKSGRET